MKVLETSISGLIDMPAITSAAARSAAASLAVYWPADENGNNDPEEKFLSFHFAHIFLRTGFSVFAEANHPSPDCRGLDLLAISANCDYFVACEFKRHVSNSMSASFKDVERVASFRLNDKLRLGRLGEDPMRVLKSCELGIGLVAGLNWSPRMRGGTLVDNAEQKQFADRIIQLEGEVGQPELVYQYNCTDATGAYYLQYAYLPSWRRT